MHAKETIADERFRRWCNDAPAYDPAYDGPVRSTQQQWTDRLLPALAVHDARQVRLQAGPLRVPLLRPILRQKLPDRSW